MRRAIIISFCLGILSPAAGHAQTQLPGGTLSTQGSQIVDQAGRNVRLACVGWNQIKTDVPLSQQTHLMASLGFNCVRIPWVNATMERDLAQIDTVVAAARSAGLRVILDNHTNEPGHGERDFWGAQQRNGLWFDSGEGTDGSDGGGNRGTTTDARFLADWEAVAHRYAGNETVIGYDLRNEPLAYPHMSEWGTGSVRDIRAMYMRVGAAIQQIDADKLIIVEPPSGDCRPVRTKPVTLPVPRKLVYSVHEYPREISAEKIDSGPEMIARMNERWGWLVSEGIAPVFIGEMGSSMRSKDSQDWAATIVPYLNGQGLRLPQGGQGVSTVWWAWGYLPNQNPDGTLESDWKTPRPQQKAVYARLRPQPAGAR